MAPVMEGNLNFPAILSLLEKTDCEYLLVEQDICQGSPFDCLKTSYDNLAAAGVPLRKEEKMEQVRLGIIGIGNMGSGHCRTILEGDRSRISALRLWRICGRAEGSGQRRTFRRRCAFLKTGMR